MSFFQANNRKNPKLRFIASNKNVEVFLLNLFSFSLCPLGGGGVFPYSLGGVCRWVRESPTYPLLDTILQICDPIPD